MFQSRLCSLHLLQHLAPPPTDLPLNYPSPLLFQQILLPPPHTTNERDHLGKGEERGKVRATKVGRKEGRCDRYWRNSLTHLRLPLSQLVPPLNPSRWGRSLVSTCHDWICGSDGSSASAATHRPRRCLFRRWTWAKTPHAQSSAGSERNGRSRRWYNSQYHSLMSELCDIIPKLLRFFPLKYNYRIKVFFY